MSDADRIETYLKSLARALRGLAASDRDDILNEIRAHLEHRAGEKRLDEAIKALGAPESCARGFLDELKLQTAFTDAGPAKTFGALLALASRRLTAAAGLFVSGIFFLFAFGFAATGVIEMVAPDKAGFFVDQVEGVYVFGAVDAPGPNTRELLGRWMIPVAAALAVLSFVIGQGLGRFFVGLMVKRAGPRAV